MELEFDKEIDAILRKARSGIGVTAADTDHLDSDAIAAFAENALPDKAKLLYIEHFADCDRCRKLLSRAVQMNVEADASEKSAATTVSEPATETVIPWYQKIFRTPNMALGMGALVLVFSGILGYLVLQRQSGTMNQTVTQMAEPEQQRGGPYFKDESGAAIPTPTNEPALSANTSASSAANSAAAAPLAENGALGRTDSAGKPVDSARSGQFQLDGASGSENNFIIDGQETTDVLTGKKPAPPASKSQPQGGIESSISSQSAELLPKGLDFSSVLKKTDKTAGAVTERDEKKLNETPKEEAKDADLSKRKQADERGTRRDMPAVAAKAGPVRSGPLQNQSNQANNQSFEMSVIRTVSGKKFSNRNGAWYDSAYSGQATTNVRRGTAEYKKLDSGLRNIADTLGGTVVVVWKAKAYRIQ